MPQRQDDPSAISAVEPLVEAIPGPAIHLRAAGVSVVLVARDGALPSVLHWGHDLGELTAEELAALAVAGTPGTVPNDLDDPTPYGALLPEHSSGWNGRPGLAGSRSGRGWSPRFALTGFQSTADPAGGGRVVATGADDRAGLTVTIEVELLPSGLVRQRGSVTSTAGAARAGETYAVDGLVLTVPVPPVATELFDLAGRWGRERSPQRLPFVVGVHSRENRRGRTGPDAPLILAAGTAGFDTRRGEVWAVHVAWSGNHVTYAERLSTGFAVLGGGELLLPGEITLAAGESYTGPWVYAAHGIGLDGVAARFHTHLRARPHHPRRPRPVVINTWEAVYFDHDLGRLTELAGVGAEVGVERFVLDDGWFRHRRDDSAGLGDWYVDEDVWPDGLHPLVDDVRGLGMEFGLWVEPEMINLDSDLARAHPDWVLGTDGRTPLPSRNQQVLDLGHPDAYAYILERLDALLTEYPIATSSGTTTATCSTQAGARTAGPACTRRPSRSTGCSTSCAPATPGSRSSRARRAAAGSTSACSSAPIGSGPATATIRWSASRSSAGPPSCCRPSWSAAMSATPRSHTTGRTHDLAFRAGTALFGSSASSGTSPEPRRSSARSWPRGWRSTRRCANCCTPARWSAPRSTTRRSPCTAWSPPTAPTPCSRWCS